MTRIDTPNLLGKCHPSWLILDGNAHARQPIVCQQQGIVVGLAPAAVTHSSKHGFGGVDFLPHFLKHTNEGNPTVNDDGVKVRDQI